jgi:hypothetical protein
MKTTRLSFVRGSVCVCASTALLAACGSADDDDSNGDAASVCTSTIAANHGHVLSITAADKLAGASKDYDIKGSASHSHTVSISAADFTTLKTGSLTLTSSTNAGHSHDIDITC